MGILTVAVVTKPFPFEGRRRMQVALKGIEELEPSLRLADHHPEREADHRAGPQRDDDPGVPRRQRRAAGRRAGHRRPDRRPGVINVDFADVRTVMSEMGLAMMGTGSAAATTARRPPPRPPSRTRCWTTSTSTVPTGILVNITAGPDFTMAEFDEVGRTIEGFASEDATVVVGTVLDPDMQDEVRVTVVATGLNRNAARQPVGQRRRPARADARADQAGPRRHHRHADRRRLLDGPDRCRHQRPGPAPGFGFARAVGPGLRAGGGGTAPRTTWTSRRSCAARRTDPPAYPPREGREQDRTTPPCPFAAGPSPARQPFPTALTGRCCRRGTDRFFR